MGLPLIAEHFVEQVAHALGVEPDRLDPGFDG